MIDKHLSNNKNTGITSRNFAELFKFTSLYCFHKITDKFKMNNRSMNIVFYVCLYSNCRQSLIMTCLVKQSAKSTWLI